MDCRNKYGNDEEGDDPKIQNGSGRAINPLARNRRRWHSRAMTTSNRDAFATRTVHAGHGPDPTTGAVAVPIYATSTYAQESPGRNKGFEYARTRNPTREALERCVA